MRASEGSEPSALPNTMSDPLETWYAVPAIAVRFMTHQEASVAERTVEREIERNPVLKAAARRKFGRLFVPWSALRVWLEAGDPKPAAPARDEHARFLSPIPARTEGELVRKLKQPTIGAE